MDDNGPFTSEVILKTEVKEEPVDEDENVKEEPVDEDENEEDDELLVEYSRISSQSSGVKQEMQHAITAVENIAFGAMRNEEVLPDSYPVVPDDYPVMIKDEVNVEEVNIEEEALSHGNAMESPEAPDLNSSSGDVAEKSYERNVVSISTSGPSREKILPTTLAQAAIISNLQAEGEPHFSHEGGNKTKVDAPAPSSLPYTVPISVLTTVSNSEPSSSVPPSSSTTISSIMPVMSMSSLPFPHLSFPTPGPSTASLDIALPLAPASCTDLVSAAVEEEEDQETVRTARKRLKRSCPVEALNVVQEILLNPPPFHVYHLHNLAAFMTARLRSMGARKRKRVENRLIQLILEEDL